MSDLDLFEYLLRLGDDRLVLGHRLSEWCGHGPILEEDIATANIALDLLGQATLFLRLGGQVERKGRDEGDAFSVHIGYYHVYEDGEVVELARRAELEVVHLTSDERDTNWPHAVLRARRTER